MRSIVIVVGITNNTNYDSGEEPTNLSPEMRNIYCTMQRIAKQHNQYYAKLWEKPDAREYDDYNEDNEIYLEKSLYGTSSPIPIPK